jgi:opacity protein-like surface antigen
MKKAFIITVCFTILFAISPIAYSADSIYLSGNLGYANVTDMNFTDKAMMAVYHKDIEPDWGLAFGAALGYRFSDRFRIEEEITYQENDVDQTGAYDANGDISSFAVLLNGYFEPATDSAYRPFFSVGVGIANLENNIVLTTREREHRTLAYNSSDSVFAYQVSAGIGYAINEKMTFDCKYRFQGYSNPNYGTTEVEYASHNIYIGIRYSF